MKTLYRKFIPLSVRKNLLPFKKKVLRTFSILTGTSLNKNGIGGVNKIFFSNRAYRKMSFAQQVEDLLLDRIISRVVY